MEFAYPGRAHYTDDMWFREMSHLNISTSGTPLSSFALTMLEEDRKFYETFPAAKRAAIEQWMYWLQQGGHCIYGTRLQRTPEPLCLYAPTPTYPIPLPPLYHSPTQVDNASDFTHHMDFQHEYNYHSSDSNPSLIASDSEFHHWTTKQSFQEATHQPSIMSLPCATRAPSPMLEVESHLIVPSQQPSIDRTYSLPELPKLYAHVPTRHRSLDYVPPRVSLDYDIPSSPRSEHPPSPISFSDWPRITGCWTIDAQAAHERLLRAPKPRRESSPDILTPADRPVISVPTTRRHHLTYRQKRAVTREDSHPYLPAKNPHPESRTRRKAQHTPKIASTVEKKSLSLACHFCRGRKIACGAPPPGSKDRTCNQCERRKLECEYPLKSRRGLRKKKGEDDSAADHDENKDEESEPGGSGA